MIEALLLIALVLVVALAGSAGWLVWDRTRVLESAKSARADAERAEQARADAEARAADLAVEAARLHTRLEAQTDAHAQRLEDLEQQAARQSERDRQRLKEIHEAYQEKLASLAAEALGKSSQQFLKVAKQAFESHSKESAADMDKRRRAIDELVKPIADTLKKTDERLTALDKSRHEFAAALKQHLELLAGETQSLHAQTGKLVQSLRAPQVRGRWGEMQLRRVVELAGMTEHCDFDTQHSTTDDAGAAFRPDMRIHLPGDRLIIVDAKAPLSAYLEAIEADTDERRAERLRAHARQLRDRVRELAGKSYQSQFDTTPDFTVLFVPGDQFLSAALQEQPDLLEHAASCQVILTTPATLIALLKAVAFGWSQASLADDAREILALGRTVHERIGVFSDHLAKLGRHLGSTLETYNKAVGSFETRLSPIATQLEDRHAKSRNNLAEPKPVTTAPRLPASADADPDEN